jgi:hypothetical protein
VGRTNSYGIYFLFHENPDMNWEKSGVYKLELVIKGTIGENEFLRRRMTINFEYLEKEKCDSYGSFFNRGELKLLKWNIAKNAT